MRYLAASARVSGVRGARGSNGVRQDRRGGPPGFDLSLVGPHMKQRRPRRRATTGTLASAPRRSGLGQGRRRWLVDCLELLGHARGRERESGSRARAKTHGAELAGVLVDPGARLTV